MNVILGAGEADSEVTQKPVWFYKKKFVCDLLAFEKGGLEPNLT